MTRFWKLNAQIHNASRRISVRLRVGFVIVALFTAGAAMVSVKQAQAIQNAHKALNDVGMPMYLLAQDIDANLKALLRHSHALRRSETREETIALQQNVERTTAALDADLRAFDAVRARDPSEQALSSSVHTAEEMLLTDVENRLHQHEQDKDIANLLAKIHRHLQQNRQTISKISFDLSAQTEGYLQAVALNARDADGLTPNFSDLYLSTVNLDAIAQVLEGIANDVVGPNQGLNPQQTARKKVLINSKIQYIVGRLAGLPDTSGRFELAQQTVALRDLFLGSNGLFPQLDARDAFASTMESSRTGQTKLINNLSTNMSRVVSATLQQVGQNADALNLAVQRTVIAICFGFLTIIVTILYISQSIVENQFNKRVRSLTHSVAAISQGRLDHPIDVSGPDELGEVAQALAVFRENARDLRRSNVDLQRFAYVAAHDLRSPLTAIADLGEWVIEDADNTLSPDSVAYLTLLKQRTLRLKALLHDLLDYARVGQAADTPQTIDMVHLTAALAAQIDREGRFKITHRGPAVSLVAPSTALRQICTNLIENAIKHHDRPHGEITVETALEGGTLILKVTDDGPGIDPKHHARVFELFQTLRPRDEVEGSGLGLAIIAKLVARYDGSVSIHSNPAKQRGTMFEIHLSLPSDVHTHPIPKEEV